MANGKPDMQVDIRVDVGGTTANPAVNYVLTSSLPSPSPSTCVLVSPNGDINLECLDDEAYGNNANMNFTLNNVGLVDSGSSCSIAFDDPPVKITPKNPSHNDWSWRMNGNVLAITSNNYHKQAKCDYCIFIVATAGSSVMHLELDPSIVNR